MAPRLPSVADGFSSEKQRLHSATSKIKSNLNFSLQQQLVEKRLLEIIFFKTSYFSEQSYKKEKQQEMKQNIAAD